MGDSFRGIADKQAGELIDRINDKCQNTAQERRAEQTIVIVDELPLCVIETFADTASDDWRDENILN